MFERNDAEMKAWHQFGGQGNEPSREWLSLWKERTRLIGWNFNWFASFKYVNSIPTLTLNQGLERFADFAFCQIDWQKLAKRSRPWFNPLSTEVGWKPDWICILQQCPSQELLYRAQASPMKIRNCKQEPDSFASSKSCAQLELTARSDTKRHIWCSTLRSS